MIVKVYEETEGFVWEGDLEEPLERQDLSPEEVALLRWLQPGESVEVGRGFRVERIK